MKVRPDATNAISQSTSSKDMIKYIRSKTCKLMGGIMQRKQVIQKLCKICGKKTKFQRRVKPIGGGDLILGLFTAGIWIALRFLMTPNFRCRVCGSK